MFSLGFLSNACLNIHKAKKKKEIIHIATNFIPRQGRRHWGGDEGCMPATFLSKNLCFM